MMSDSPSSYPFHQRVRSRKFVFSIFCFLLTAFLLWFEKITGNIFEGVTTAIVVSYLASNVAYRYVDERSKVKIKSSNMENIDDSDI